MRFSVILWRGFMLAYVAHLNADDFGPIQVHGGSIPVRLSCVADVPPVFLRTTFI